jgi:hemin uptake protein HemP
MAVRRARPEQQLQKAVLDHLRWRAAPGTFAFHPANGGARSPIEARILKSQGVVAGVPDVIILHDGKTYGLELKATGGHLSPAQRDCHERMRAAGAEVATAVGIDAALAQLAEWRLFK